MESGFARGDRDEHSPVYSRYLFHPDYHVGLILYEEFLRERTRELVVPTQGGIYNSFYIYPLILYSPHPSFDLMGSVLWAYPDEVDGMGVVKDAYLGVEFDGGFCWKVTDKAHLGAEAGYLLPGDGLGKDLPKPYKILGKFTFEF